MREIVIPWCSVKHPHSCQLHTGVSRIRSISVSVLEKPASESIWTGKRSPQDSNSFLSSFPATNIRGGEKAETRAETFCRSIEGCRPD